MKKLAVLTTAIGAAYQKLAELTHPTLKRYAERIGAEFLVIDRPSICESMPSYEKLQIFNFLNQYDRVLYLDTDIIVRDDCPNLFEIVPEHKLGAFNEGAFIDRLPAMSAAVRQFRMEIEKWDRQYYNAGVLVVSRMHKFLFQKPATLEDNFYEQSLLNLRIIKTKTKVHELPYAFNRLSCMDPLTGEHRLSSYIVHYAGSPGGDFLLNLVKGDLERWRREEPNYRHERNIHVKVHGGLGDEVCAEPIIRYLVEKAYPEASITVSTWFPRLFKHLPVKAFQMGEFNPEFDTPYYLMETLVAPEHPIWQFVSANLVHTTDFCSLMCLRKILPDKDKQIKLQVTLDDVAEVIDAVGITQLSDFVLVHPGRGWPSKTFPPEFWKEVVVGLQKAGHKVAIIGKDVSDEQGTVQFDLPTGVLDLRNILSLGGLMAIISQGKVLVSNDSSPVHIAGAFDNQIILIPSCKHPDHVLPVRNGERYYKAQALYKRLTCEAVDSNPTQVHGQTIDKVPGAYEEFLPEPQEVINSVAEALSKG